MSHKVWEMNKNDEYYTPKVLVWPIIEYIKKGSYILCPFDTKNSEFVIELSKAGFKVDYSHISKNGGGRDFFTYTKKEVKKYDYIISNPPFSLKRRVFEKLMELGKPWAMVMGLQALSNGEIGRLFISYHLQLMIFDKRISFDGNHSTFGSGYICYNFLPRDLIAKKLVNDNQGKNFQPSKMYEEEIESNQKRFKFDE